MPQAIQSQRTMTVLKASVGRAIRFPTVEELYGATSTTNSQFINDPNLRPEKSWTSELSAEQDVGHGTLCGTLFTENTRDALYSRTIADPVANKNISRVQNIGRIETRGAEIAFSGTDVLARGLDLSSSVTYANSIIKENVGFDVTPGDTLGKWQPNIPKWRAAAPRRQQVLHSRRAHSVESQQNRHRRSGYRQRKQLPVLEFPPVSAT